MMINVDPKYLRTCQLSNNPCPDDILLRREMIGFPRKDFSGKKSQSKGRNVRDRGSDIKKHAKEVKVNIIE